MDKMYNIEVMGLGVECAEKSRILTSEIRDYHRIHFILNGCQSYNKLSTQYKSAENTGFVIFPGEAVIYNPDPDNPCEYFWIVLGGEHIQEILTLLNISRENPLFDAGIEKSEMQVLIKNIFSAYMTMRSEFTESIVNFFKHIQVKENLSNSKSTFVEKALNYMHQHYAEDIAISDIANELAVDRTYLYKLFRKNIGFSPQEYLINHRVTKAKDLLRTTNLPISDVALEVGFTNFSDFARQFKKRYNISASQFRKNFTEIASNPEIQKIFSSIS